MSFLIFFITLKEKEILVFLLCVLCCDAQLYVS